MLALYRSGRQADALAAYRAARAVLVDEIGIEPGTELRELEQAILRQDPSIAAPRGAGLPRGSRRRMSILVAAAAVLIAGIVAGLLAALGRGGSPTVVPNSVIEINPRTNGVRDVIPLGRRPDTIIAVGDAVFVASPLSGAITRIDTDTHQTRTVNGLAEPVALAVTGDRLWVGGVHSDTISRFHARTMRPVDRVRVDGVATPWLATGARSVWAVLPHPLVPAEEQVLRLDPDSGLVQRRFRTGALPSQVAFGGGAAWVSNFGNGTVSRIDARTGQVASFRVEGVGGLEYAFGALWILTSRPTNSVRRVDPVTLLTDAIVPVGRCPWEIAAGAGAIWTTNCNDGTVTRIDPRTNAVAATIDVGYRPLSVSVGRDAVWVGIAAGPSHL
jgi:YVTN family beta-propeller protein